MIFSFGNLKNLSIIFYRLNSNFLVVFYFTDQQHEVLAKSFENLDVDCSFSNHLGQVHSLQFNFVAKLKVFIHLKWYINACTHECCLHNLAEASHDHRTSSDIFCSYLLDITDELPSIRHIQHYALE